MYIIILNIESTEPMKNFGESLGRGRATTAPLARSRKWRVTLNLKVNGQRCSSYYIFIVILDLGYVEIDTKIYLIGRNQPKIRKVMRSVRMTLNVEVSLREGNKYSLIFVIFIGSLA